MDLLPGDMIVKFSGTLLDHTEKISSTSRYIQKIGELVYMDVKDKKNFDGRYINDDPHSDKEANTRIMTTQPVQADMSIDQ